jgi:hypothetical protein
VVERRSQAGEGDEVPWRNIQGAVGKYSYSAHTRASVLQEQPGSCPVRSRLPLNRPAPAEILNGGEGKRWTLQGYYGIANAFVHTMPALLYLLA